MNAREIARKSLQPFDNLGVIKNYFAAVKAMDSAAVADRPFDTKRIMGLWHEDGTLTIGGKPLGKDHRYAGARELSGFYRRRAKGVNGEIAVNISGIDVANAKSAEHVTASGQRYVVNRKEEGLQVPFTHNFTLRDGRIADLKIHVGVPTRSEIAPVGGLEVEDMGRLAAMAWMVA